MVCQLMSTSRKNMALIRGATLNIVTSRCYARVLSAFPIPQVRQVEELDRKKVTFTAHFYRDNSLSSGSELLSGTQRPLLKNWRGGDEEAGVPVSQTTYVLSCISPFTTVP